MPTLQHLLRDYNRTVLVNQQSGEGTARSLALLIEPMRRMPADSIRPAQILERINEVGETAPVHAKRMLSYARSFFEWAATSGAIELNPTWGIQAQMPDRARARQLTLDEVVMIWRAAEVLGERPRHAVRLLILTAAPRDQVGALRLSELQRDAGGSSVRWWPTAVKAAGGGGGTIVLPPLARDIVLDAVAGRCLGGEFLLSRTGKSPFDGWSKAKRALDQELVGLKRRGQFEPWWLNDLRTSFPALAGEHAGVDAMVAEARLGRISRFPNPDAKLWLQSSAMDETVSDALAAWDAVLRKKLRVAKSRS